MVTLSLVDIDKDENGQPKHHSSSSGPSACRETAYG